ARAVNRDDIVRGTEELGMPLDNVIAEVITALKSDAERLELQGVALSSCAKRSEVEGFYFPSSLSHITNNQWARFPLAPQPRWLCYTEGSQSSALHVLVPPSK